MYLIIGILHTSNVFDIEKIPNYCSYKITEYDGYEAVVF